jgi:hypothetical protein
MAYSWKPAVASSGSCFTTVCVCAPPEYVENMMRPLESLKISMSISCA